MARHRLALAAALALACATTPPHDPAVERCIPDGGFERGLADGKAGRPPDLGWLVLCDPAVHDPIGRAYTEGHQAGRAERDVDAPPAPPGTGSERAYVCEVQARGDTFTAYGATKIAADAVARAACREKNPDHFCEESACRRNE